MRCWILLIACLGAWCAVAVAADSRPNAKEANELIKQLRELEKDGRYSEMVRPTARLVDIVRQIKGESSAEYAKWLGFQGAIHVAIGDYENAEKSLRSAVEVFQKVRRPLNKETRIMMVDARGARNRTARPQHRKEFLSDFSWASSSIRWGIETTPASRGERPRTWHARTNQMILY